MLDGDGDCDGSDSDSDDSSTPVLDVEDDDARQRRLARLLSRTNSTANQPRTVPLPGSSQVPLQPPTQLFATLDAFLPQIAAANAELLQRAQHHPESVDIEHIDASANGRYIEMNLGLGVFTMRRRRSDAGHTTSSSSDDSDSSGAPEGDKPLSRSQTSDSESESGSNGERTDAAAMLINAVSEQRPIRPLPKRPPPSIVVLSDQPAP